MRHGMQAALLAASLVFVCTQDALSDSEEESRIHFDPAVCINGLFLATLTSNERESGEAHDETHESHSVGGFERPAQGAALQELEVQFSGEVDSLVAGQLVLAIHDGELDVEEAFARTLSLPAGLEARVGRMLLPFGNHNTLHTHAWPFVNPPLVHEVLLGEHGLADDGLRLSWSPGMLGGLRLDAGVYDGSHALFSPEDSGEPAWNGRIESALSVGDQVSLSFGASGVTAMDAETHRTTALGADMAFYWRPAGDASIGRLLLQAEWMGVTRDQAERDWRRAGAYVMARLQVSESGWIQGRHDWLETQSEPWPGGGQEQSEFPRARLSALLAWAPGASTILRVQYDRQDLGESGNEDALLLQLAVAWETGHEHDH